MVIATVVGPPVSNGSARALPRRVRTTCRRLAGANRDTGRPARAGDTKEPEPQLSASPAPTRYAPPSGLVHLQRIRNQIIRATRAARAGDRETKPPSSPDPPNRGGGLAADGGVGVLPGQVGQQRQRLPRGGAEGPQGFDGGDDPRGPGSRLPALADQRRQSWHRRRGVRPHFLQGL